MSSREKRASTRYDVELEMQLTYLEQEADALSINLSLGGALLKSSAINVRVGERVGVSFRLPDLDKPLTAKAEVRWVNGEEPVVLGIQFVTGFRAKETWALGRFLERHRPT